MQTYTFKCPNCEKSIEEEIFFKYELILINYTSKEYYLTQADKFQFISPRQLYQKIKKYFISENIVKLDINNILLLEDKINLFLVLLLFSQKNLNFDFLFPYIKPKATGKAEFYEKKKDNEISFFGYKAKEPVIIRGNNSDNHTVFRKFNVIQPLFNPAPKKVAYFGVFSKLQNEETPLSFTIKNSKPKGKKKK